MSADPSVTATLSRQLHDGTHAPASSQPFSPLPPVDHQQSQLALTPEPESLSGPGSSTSSGSNSGLVPSSSVTTAAMTTTTTTITNTAAGTATTNSGSVQTGHASALRPLPVPPQLPDNQSVKLSTPPSSSSSAAPTPSNTPTEPQSAEIPASLRPRLNPTSSTTDPLPASCSFTFGPGSIVPSPHSAVGSQTHTPASSSTARSPPSPPLPATQSSPSPLSSSSSLLSSSTRPSQDQEHGQHKGQQQQQHNRHRNEAVLTSVAPRSSSLPLSSIPLAAMGNSGSTPNTNASKPLPLPPSQSQPRSSSSSSSEAQSQTHSQTQTRTRTNAPQQLPYQQPSHSTHQRQLSGSPSSISTGTGTSSSTGKAKALFSRAFGGRWKKNEEKERSLAVPGAQEMPSSGSAPSKLASQMFGSGKKLNLGSKGSTLAPPIPPKSTGMGVTSVSAAAPASNSNANVWSRSGTYPTPSPLSTSASTSTSPFSSTPSQSQAQKQTQLSTPMLVEQVNRSSIIPLSPAIESAVSFMKLSENEKEEGKEMAPLPSPPKPPASSSLMPSPSVLPSAVPLALVRKEDASNVNMESVTLLVEREKEKEKTEQTNQPAQQSRIPNERSKQAEKERAEEEAEEGEEIGSIPAARPRPRRPLSESFDNMIPFNSPSDKRKSDSTIGHSTVRPSANASGVGMWSSRPVSMAESFQSTYTIVPVAVSSGNGSGSGSALVLVDKRLSAPEGGIDFGAGMSVAAVQEVSEREEGNENIDMSMPSKEGGMKKEEVKGEEKPTSNARQLKRRSMSLNVNIGAGSNSAANGGKGATASVHLAGPELKHPSYSISEGVGFGYGIAQPATPERNALARLKAATRNHKLPALPLNSNTSTENASIPSTPNALQTFVYPSRKPTSPSQLPRANYLSSYSNYPNQQHHTTFRQTAVSITNSLAPAADFAKKAVEKVRGAFTLGHGHGNGSMSASTSSASISSMAGMGSGSGYGSSTSTSHSHSGSTSWGTEGLSTAPSAYVFPTEFGVGGGLRKAGSKEGFLNSSSSGLTPGVGKKKEREEKKRRRTPNASSGGGARSYAGSVASMSVSTCASTNESMDGPFGMAVGPILGTLLREPIVGRGSSMVFGRDLERCVRETGIWVGRSRRDGYGEDEEENGLAKMRPELKVFEERMLPAVVVRCAQHLLVWGVQEEGLFRVPGRAAHITKLRNEFDTGADYDMSACSPGDLDPHAVASIFKAYLRELPEHILTQKLQQYFDIAIEQDSAASVPADVLAASENDNPTSKFGMKTAFGLPISQRPLPSSSANGFTSSNLRKPPSLSTLAMPSFNGMHPPSRGLLKALRSLIGRLPQENKDLLRTVVDLIRATAKEAKATKMPLSNLLMVFLPSLNVSAQLLKVLCEEEGIWEGCGVYGVGGEAANGKRDTVVLDTKGEKGVEEGAGEKDDRNFSERQDAETEDDEEDDIDPQRRWTIVNRPQVPTIYLDSRSQCSSASVTTSSRSSIFLDQDASADSSMTRDTEGISISDDGNFQGYSGDIDNLQLSSSVESVSTPMTSSGQPSLSHLPHLLNNTKNFPEKELQTSGGYPVVAESTSPGLEFGAENLGGSRKKRFVISNPMPMQSPLPTVNTKESQSSTPAPIGKQTSTSPKRRSIPTLSIPNISFVSASGNAESDSALETRSLANEGGNLNGKGLKTKKPSLRLLFSKHSTDSLKGSNGSSDKSSILSGSSGRPFISAPLPPSSPGPLSLSSSPSRMMRASPEIRSPSDSSVSTPLSAFTAPTNGSVTELPPVLDTTIEGPSLSAELGLDVSPASEKHDIEPKQESRKERIKTLVGKTPIADWYKNASTSSFTDLSTMMLKEDGKNGIGELAASTLRSVPGRSKGKSPSNFVSIGDEEFGSEEDWTRTVLLAADMEFESRRW